MPINKAWFACKLDRRNQAPGGIVYATVFCGHVSWNRLPSSLCVTNTVERHVAWFRPSVKSGWSGWLPEVTVLNTHTHYLVWSVTESCAWSWFEILFSHHSKSHRYIQHAKHRQQPSLHSFCTCSVIQAAHILTSPPKSIVSMQMVCQLHLTNAAVSASFGR